MATIPLYQFQFTNPHAAGMPPSWFFTDPPGLTSGAHPQTGDGAEHYSPDTAHKVKAVTVALPPGAVGLVVGRTLEVRRGERVDRYPADKVYQLADDEQDGFSLVH